MAVIGYGGKRNSRPIVGVALSGGGLRGLAHIGVLQALISHHIPIDMIAGTSAGSIVAAMYACGYSPRAMEEMALTLDPMKFVDLKLNMPQIVKNGMQWLFTGRSCYMPLGLIKGEKVEEYLSMLWKTRTMRDTRIPLAITAVDIISADTVFFTTPIPGKRAILNARYYHNIQIAEAVRSSISIPGIFFPKKIRGMILVDGAVKDNLPTDILDHMGADIIIAADLGYAGQANYNIDSVSDLLLHCLDIMGREVTLLKAEPYTDVMIRPNVAHADAKNIAKCIRIGERAALERMSTIYKTIENGMCH